MTDATPIRRTEYWLSPKQYATMAELQCKITAVVVHPFSGAATVEENGVTMANIDQEGRVQYAYQFGDGSYAYPRYWRAAV